MKMAAMLFSIFSLKIPPRNKKSLAALKEKLKGYSLEYVCTGHSGMHPYSDHIFAYIDESAVFGRTTPFHKDGEYNPFVEKK